MIIVTGGSGFIGSYVCANLAEAGEKIRIVDLKAPANQLPHVEFSKGSILDAGKLAELFEGANAIIHLAAQVDVQASIADPNFDFKVNAEGTANVLDAARKSDVKKVVFASSAAVYGNPVSVPVSESHPTNPLSPYGKSKLEAERKVLEYGRLYGVQNCALRLFNVYGKGQNPKSQYSGVITKFASAIAGGTQPIIYGDGKQTRDFVHAKDVASAFSLALASKGCKTPINIASGKETSVIQLLETMCSLAGKKPNPKFMPERAGEIKRSVADISLAKKVLNYSPKVGLEEGLKEIVQPQQ